MNGGSHPNPLLEARDLTKVYAIGSQEVRALDGVSLRIMPGEFVAIMGSSGSGKSTLMNVIGTLDRPTGGTLSLGGVGIQALGDDELATLRNRFIGFVFQHFNLLPRTPALEQVMLPLRYGPTPLRAARDAALERLAQVGLATRADHHPQQLSGGQQQRVAIARALVGNPLILLADEPTGALDSRTSQDIMNLLAELNAQGVTIVVVTHDPRVAACCKRVVRMSDGRIVEDRPAATRAQAAARLEDPVHAPA
jgi:putative ABC transport system ATP-binding protein